MRVLTLREKPFDRAKVGSRPDVCLNQSGPSGKGRGITWKHMVSFNDQLGIPFRTWTGMQSSIWILSKNTLTYLKVTAP
jgi:hypothetical protein